MNPPLHTEIASAAWRFAAGFVNFLVIGAVIVVAQLSAPDPDVVRWIAIGFAGAYWAACGCSGRSVGAALCMLDLRRSDMCAPRRRSRYLRALPYLAVAVIAYVPAGRFATSADLLRSLGLIVSGLFLLTEAVALVIRRRTVMDGALGLVVVRLGLPPHLRPRLFGVRVA